MSCSSVGWSRVLARERMGLLKNGRYISFIPVEITLLWLHESPPLVHISGLSDFYSTRKVMLVIQCVQFAENISCQLIYAPVSGNVQLIVLLIYCFIPANQD